MRAQIDTLDAKALARLMENGRMTWADLAYELDLSPPAAAERVRRLEERQLIVGYRAVPNAIGLGYEILAFVYVTLGQPPERRSAFIKMAQRHPLILECHHIAGDDDFVLKVRCRSLSELDEFVTNDLKARNGVARTRTTIALSTLKETSSLPVRPDSDR